MEIELRPLSLGEILDRTFQLYRSRFFLFTGIAVLAAAVRLFWSVIVVLLNRWLASGHNLLALRLLAASATMLSLLVAFLAAGLALAALTRAVSQLYLGLPTGVAEAYRDVRARTLRFTGLNLLAVFLAWWPMLLLFVLLGVEIGMASRVGSVGAARTLSVLYGLMGFGFLLLIPLCVWLTSRYALANAAAVLEGLNIRAALRRSVQLSKGMRGRMVLGAACIVILETIFGLVGMIPLFSTLAHSRGHIPVWATVYQLGWSFAANALFVPLFGILLALFYYDGRIRKEGFDVEWQLERAAPVSSLASTDGGALPAG